MTIKIVYDIKKQQLGRKIGIEGYFLRPPYKNWNRSIIKKFPIETLSEMIDSTFPRFSMLESVLSKIVLTGNIFGTNRFRIL